MRGDPGVALVQPNLRRTAETVLESMVLQSLLTLERVPPGAVELVIWPENAILDDLDKPDKYLEDLRYLNGVLGADMLVGSVAESADDLTRSMNSAFLVRDGRAVGRYDMKKEKWIWQRERWIWTTAWTMPALWC